MQPALGHRRELDGIRGIAIALVVVFHALSPTPIFQGGGTIGVQLFFVLSGFLITSILADEWRSNGRIGLGGFYTGRLRRLVPALALFLAVYAIWSLVSGMPRLIPILVSGTYISNWARVAGVDLAEVGHTWSLAVEEQFYLLWPLLLIVLLRARVPALVVALLAVGLVAWRVVITNPDVTWDRIDYATDVNAAALLAGAAIALIGVPKITQGRLLGAASVAALVLLALTQSGIPWSNAVILVSVGFPLAIVASGGLIIAGLNTRSEWLGARPLVFLGAISYGLYLWHTGLNAVLADDYGWTVIPRLLLVPLSIAIAWASLRWVERPFRRRRTRPAAAEASTEAPELAPIPAT
jgi:peptidoglycan/LPS O-acetylase OafA/YrhL